jgi:hypothetical protein
VLRSYNLTSRAPCPSVPVYRPVPSMAARSADRRTTVEAVLGEEGSLTGTFIDRQSATEVAAARWVYRSMPKADYVALTRRWISRGVPGAAVNGIEVRDSGRCLTAIRFR